MIFARGSSRKTSLFAIMIDLPGSGNPCVRVSAEVSQIVPESGHATQHGSVSRAKSRKSSRRANDSPQSRAGRRVGRDAAFRRRLTTRSASASPASASDQQNLCSFQRRFTLAGLMAGTNRDEPGPSRPSTQRAAAVWAAGPQARRARGRPGGGERTARHHLPCASRPRGQGACARDDGTRHSQRFGRADRLNRRQQCR